MKLIIPQEKLKGGINIAEKISGRAISLPILNNLLISSEKNFLKITSTDLEVGINWWTLAKTEKEGKAVIPAQTLSGFVGFLPSESVTLEGKGADLEIQCKNHKTLIKGFNPEDFPIIPQVPEDDNVLVKTQAFCKSLNQVVNFATVSATRPEISGIYLSFQKGSIVVAATDSFRLGEKSITLKDSANNLSKDYAVILPQKAAKEIVNIFGEEDEEMRICFSPNQILFETYLPETKHPKVQLVSRLVEGEYPDYKTIIPKSYETETVLQRKEFISQLKMASLFSGKLNEVKLKIDSKEKKVNFFSQSPDLGKYDSFLSAKVDGNSNEITFNYKFLLEGLLSMPSAEVTLGVSAKEGGKKDSARTENQKGVLRPKGDDSFLYLVMPINVD